MSEVQDDTQPPKGYVPKKLIVCCDGTWKDSDSGILTGTGFSSFFRGQKQVSTNVTKITHAIRPLDSQGRQQVVYYQAGVGSEGNIIERLVGGALGTGLSDNIREAYTFIATNYIKGDEIYLIGFSRGAFTARSIGGIIGDLGLLTRAGLEHLVDVFDDWENSGTSNYKTELSKHDSAFSVTAEVQPDPKVFLARYRAALLKLGLTQSEDIPIKAIGVWETVGSLGIPVNPFFQRLGLPTMLRTYRFYDTDLGKDVENAFQALALDEARAAYRPTLWQKLPGFNTNLKQTWFPGVHSDIGGGYADSGLSNNTLAWMMSNLAPFLDFYPDYVRQQYQQNQAYLKQEKVPKTALMWAASQLKNTATGFFALLGVVWRTPGRYMAVGEKSATIKTNEPLQNTHEHIHVSVRSREYTGGLNAKNKMAAYKPKSLKHSEYKLLDANAAPGEAQWQYVGKKKPFTILPEDDLGVFEKEIFQDYVSKKLN